MNTVRMSSRSSQLEQLKHHLHDHLVEVCCPVHGERATGVEVYGDSIYDLHFRCDCCCDELADAMVESIGDTPRSFGQPSLDDLIV